MEVAEIRVSHRREAVLCHSTDVGRKRCLSRHELVFPSAIRKNAISECDVLSLTPFEGDHEAEVGLHALPR